MSNTNKASCERALADWTAANKQAVSAAAAASRALADWTAAKDSAAAAVERAHALWRVHADLESITWSYWVCARDNELPYGESPFGNNNRGEPGGLDVDIDAVEAAEERALADWDAADRQAVSANEGASRARADWIVAQDSADAAAKLRSRLDHNCPPSPPSPSCVGLLGWHGPVVGYVCASCAGRLHAGGHNLGAYCSEPVWGVSDCVCNLCGRKLDGN